MFKRACVERFTKILTCTNMYKKKINMSKIVNTSDMAESHWVC